VSKHQTILDRIRCCGRLGDEEEARRLYLVCNIGFREYRRAYKAGQRESRKIRTVQKSTRAVIQPPDIYDTFIFNGTFVNAEWDRFVEQTLAKKGND